MYKTAGTTVQYGFETLVTILALGFKLTFVTQYEIKLVVTKIMKHYLGLILTLNKKAMQQYLFYVIEKHT